VPIFKKGNKEEVQNYRPIAIVPALSKIFELAIKIRLTDYFDKQGFFSERQYGYRKSRSTITALLEVVNRIIQTYEDGSILSATFLDLSKAFDCINHEILLEKLQHYGVRSQTLQLISNYLHDRSQEVFYNSQTSGSVMLNIGVPQGSILGPLLFIIYANDFESNITTATPYLYADDTTLVSVNSNPAAVETQSQQSYSEAKQWFLMNKMTLNEKKNCTTTFHVEIFHMQRCD
jgi:retron-type reverse transcriptase